MQVFDNPFVHMVVSEVIRKRLDTKSIIQLLRGLDAPPGNCPWRKLSGIMATLIRLNSCNKLVTVFSLHYSHCVEYAVYGVFLSFLKELWHTLRSLAHFQLMESWFVPCLPNIMPLSACSSRLLYLVNQIYLCQFLKKLFHQLASEGIPSHSGTG